MSILFTKTFLLSIALLSFMGCQAEQHDARSSGSAVSSTEDKYTNEALPDQSALAHLSTGYNLTDVICKYTTSDFQASELKQIAVAGKKSYEGTVQEYRFLIFADEAYQRLRNSCCKQWNSQSVFHVAMEEQISEDKGALARYTLKAGCRH